MKILSIDIGIKNLAVCLMEITNKCSSNYNIIIWEIINLSSQYKESIPICTQSVLKPKKKVKKNKPEPEIKSSPIPCIKLAKFKKGDEYYCCVHSKNHPNLKIPNSELKIKNLKKIKKDILYDIYVKYISQDNTNVIMDKNKITKSTIIEKMEQYINSYCFDNLNTVNAKDISLIDIGITLNIKFDELLKNNRDIDYILIENQISPLANRMKTIQGMVTQYFIMKNILNIQFISSSNKLKINANNLNEKNISYNLTSYNERKKQGEKNTIIILNINENLKKWILYFNKHRKRDDLADAFLQAIWFIINKI
jgi:hypothetical protein